MNENSMSVIEALNHVQSWLNSGEYDKVIQGCQEILTIEPGNARALSLMRQAQERRHADTMKPAEPEKDPLTSLEVEKPAPAAARMDDFTLPEEEDPREERGETRKLFLAMLVPAVLVVLLGGGLIYWLANRDREQTIEDNLTDETPVEDELGYLEANNQRLSDMNKMLTVIEEYYEENNEYPAADEIESVMAKSDLDEVPVDPRQGEIDKAGSVFGYVYAVYDDGDEKNSIYVLSALFEDDKGFGSPWAKGGQIRNYPDFRDYKEDHVTFIGGDEDDVEIPGKGPEDEEDEDADTEE
jgi:hypothetical protein